MKQPTKAVVYSGLEYGLIYGVVRQHKLFIYSRSVDNDIAANAFQNDRNRLTWYLAGAIILSVLDAYVDAHLYHFDVSDDLSRNDRTGLSVLGVKMTFSWRFE